jgi:hypothetical protein
MWFCQFLCWLIGQSVGRELHYLQASEPLRYCLAIRLSAVVRQLTICKPVYLLETIRF